MNTTIEEKLERLPWIPEYLLFGCQQTLDHTTYVCYDAGMQEQASCYCQDEFQESVPATSRMDQGTTYDALQTTRLDHRPPLRFQSSTDKKPPCMQYEATNALPLPDKPTACVMETPLSAGEYQQSNCQIMNQNKRRMVVRKRGNSSHTNGPKKKVSVTCCSPSGQARHHAALPVIQCRPPLCSSCAPSSSQHLHTSLPSHMRSKGTHRQ